MTRSTRIVLLPLLVLVSVSVSVLPAGCADSSSGPVTLDQGEELRLSQVGDALRDYQLNQGKPPRSLKDLLASPGASGGADLVASGDVVVQFGQALPDTQEEPGGSPDQAILAYGKEVPTKGGPVLLLNRTVKRMTADEFKAAAPAKAAP